MKRRSAKQLNREIAVALANRSVSAAEQAQVAADAIEDQRPQDFEKIIDAIPPIQLGRTWYRVLYGRSGGDFTIQGPRGGVSHLVPSTNDPTVIAHNANGKTTWYRHHVDGTYSVIK